jgi:hypothetical protein
MAGDIMDEIERRVRERFPKLETERRCATEKRMRDAARNSYRQTLINEFQTKAAILESVDASADGN